MPETVCHSHWSSLGKVVATSCSRGTLCAALVQLILNRHSPAALAMMSWPEIARYASRRAQQPRPSIVRRIRIEKAVHLLRPAPRVIAMIDSENLLQLTPRRLAKTMTGHLHSLREHIKFGIITTQ